MEQKKLNQLLSELRNQDYSTLLGSIVSYNSDPQLIECDEDAEPLANSIMADGSLVYARTSDNVDDWQALCNSLDLTDATVIYEIVNTNDCGLNCTFILNGDF